MASTVKAMSFPCQQSLLDPTAAPPSSSSAQNNPAVATAAQTSASMAIAARNYATPKRVGGLAAVTPGTPGDDGLVNTNAGGGTSQQHQQQESGQKNNHAQQQQGEGLASAPSIDETAAAASSPAKQPTARVAPAATVVKKFPIARPPSIQLGPRVSPAMRKSPPKTVFKAAAPAAGGQQVVGVGAPTRSSPMKPRNLDGALERGQSAAAGMALVAAAASATHQPLPLPMMKHELERVGDDDIECPSTPGAPIIPPPPSSFLTCKISPMRSTSAKKSGGVGEKKEPQLLVREKTPPPPVASSNMDVSLIIHCFPAPHFIESNCVETFVSHIVLFYPSPP